MHFCTADSSIMKDLHTHIERGPYTVEWAEKFINKAVETGMDEICLLEHSIRFREFHPTFDEARSYNLYQKKWFDEKAKAAVSLSNFKKLGDELRSRSYPIKVSLGLEICWFPQHADIIKQLTADGYFDYLLGSVHWIDNWTFNQRKYQWLGKDWNKIYSRYFELENELVESGIFDIIAHPDLVMCHGLYPDCDLADFYRSLCKKAAENSVAVEMNTSHSIGINSDFLKIAKEEGVKFTTGSDAHRPEDVGRKIKEATALINA